jgi:hypothetical protein
LFCDIPAATISAICELLEDELVEVSEEDDEDDFFLSLLRFELLRAFLRWRSLSFLSFFLSFLSFFCFSPRTL